ncbi:MAG: hypothetical protein PF485_01340 [Bacteroidales bacterium]|nr:hypothetical protein [Bacteroidales bacterium]
MNPKIPVLIVVRNWEKLPIPVANTPKVRFPLSIKSTLPPMSPILFGVNMPNVIPERTALKAALNLRCWILLIKIFHLKVSILQLKIINKNTNSNISKSQKE